MSTFARYVKLVVVGWGITAVFGLIVAVAAGEPGPGLLLVGVSVVMGTWLLARPGRVALFVSTGLGLLHALEQGAYSAADVRNGIGATLAWDLLGLVGALTIVAGAVLALRSRQPGPSAHATV